MSKNDYIILSQKSLKGLWVGDCIGQSVIKKKIKSIDDLDNIEDDSLPYTDDTEQSLILSKHVYNNDDIVSNEILNEFCNGFCNSKIQCDYGRKTKEYFNNIYKTNFVFPNNSFGNGCLMRIVPSIVYFTLNDDKDIIQKCLNSCLYTHNHIESFNSIIFLVKFIQWLVINREEVKSYCKSESGSIIQGYLLSKILENDITSEILIKEINKIIDNDLYLNIKDVYKLVGNGSLATCFDTLPVCIWLAIRNINNYKNAIEECISIGGDVDTICAIVGSIVSLFSDIPQEFINKCKKYEY